MCAKLKVPSKTGYLEIMVMLHWTFHEMTYWRIEVQKLLHKKSVHVADLEKKMGGKAYRSTDPDFDLINPEV